MNFKFKKVLVKDTREVGKPGGEFKEFEIGDYIEVITERGETYKGTICEITPVFLEILDENKTTHGFWFNSLKDVIEIAQ